MLRFIALRLGRALLTIALVVTFAFVVLRLSGDPALMIMSPDAPPEALAAFRRAWGLDQATCAQAVDKARAVAARADRRDGDARSLDLERGENLGPVARLDPHRRPLEGHRIGADQGVERRILRDLFHENPACPLERRRDVSDAAGESATVSATTTVR